MRMQLRNQRTGTAWLATAILAIVGSVLPASAEVVPAGGGGIVFSSRCDGFLARVPEGWVLDNQAAASQGVDMLFYPDGADASNLNALQAYAYVMPSVKRTEGQQNALSAQMLAHDALAAYRREDPAATLLPVDWTRPVPQSVQQVRLYELHAPGIRKHERIAYVENQTVIFAVVLSVTSPVLLEQHADVVQSIVSSGLILTGSQRDGRCSLPRPADAS